MKNLRKWYFSINERGFDGCLDQITVATRSCLQKTSLVPHCVYGGSNAEHIRVMEDLGVKVIPHRISIEGDLSAAYQDRYTVFSGHWLRIDLPILETEEDLVLYTDTDVVFLKELEEIPSTELIAAAPEFKIDDYSKFNSGVMLMNLRNLRKVHGEFIESIKERLHNDFRYPAHDQESYNRFFRDKYTHMSPIYNWKVYWGVNPEAVILHLHGPKFHIANQLRAGDEKGVPPGHTRLWKKDPYAYVHYEKIFRQYL